MKNYEKIPFDQISDITSYVEKKLRAGHIIIQIIVNESLKQIDELISYANDKEYKSYYRNLADSDEQLKESVITKSIDPYYAFKDEEDNCSYKKHIKVDVSFWDYADFQRNYVFAKKN